MLPILSALADRPEYRETLSAHELGGAWREHVLKLVGIYRLILRLFWLPVRTPCGQHPSAGVGQEVVPPLRGGE